MTTATRFPARLILSLLLLLALTGSVLAGDMTPEERRADFNQLVSLIRSTYGMLDYKKEVLGIDIAVLEASYGKQLETLTSDEQFYNLLEMFVAEFKDAHFTLARPSSAWSALGFDTARIEGKAIITGVYDSLGARFPFKPGDELVALDGKPVATILREMVPHHSNSQSESALGLLTRILTERYGGFGPVPGGVCRVTVLPRFASATQDVTLPWMMHGQRLPGMSFLAGRQTAFTSKADGLLDERFHRPDVAIAPQAAAFSSVTSAAWAPEDANPVPNGEFSACIFDSPKGLLGYARISSFSPGDTKKATAEFRKVIQAMRLTRGLIIDEVDNPGGSIGYMNTLASMLVEKPLELPLWAMRANRSTLSNCRQNAQEASDPISKATYEHRATQIEEAFNQGLSMTAFGYGWGTVSRAPDTEVRYSKPILILTNDQCYSCGDMFPALMQDNKRARIFGSTTAGAGGSVVPAGTLNYSGARVRITETVYKRRPGDTFIENVGVKPDVPYEFTVADVAEFYKSYRAAYTDALCKMIQ